MRVLVVDDDAVARLVVDRMVTSLGHECVLADSGSMAWRTFEADRAIDVVITDRLMPDMDGLVLCGKIRDSARPAAYTYIVVSSGLGDDESAREGMLAGADDYLAKPLRQAQLELKLIAADRVRALHERLARLTEDLHQSARRDPMTGLSNRLQLAEDLRSLADRVQRYGHRYSVALLDVDHFKEFNDRYGHQAGDAALQAVAEVLRTRARAGDGTYRYGGEEFLCIFPEQSAASALVATGRLLQAVRELDIVHERSAHGVLTISAGVSELWSDRSDVVDVLRRADAALYEAKDAGRDHATLGRAQEHVTH